MSWKVCSPTKGRVYSCGVGQCNSGGDARPNIVPPVFLQHSSHGIWTHRLALQIFPPPSPIFGVIHVFFKNYFPRPHQAFQRGIQRNTERLRTEGVQPLACRFQKKTGRAPPPPYWNDPLLQEAKHDQVFGRCSRRKELGGPP